MNASNKPIRVLQVGMSTNYGGTESIIYEIYRHIDRSQVQFDFLNVYDEPLAKEEWLRSLGANVYRLKLQRRRGILRYFASIKRFYLEHRNQFDVVVCNVQCLDQIDMARFAKKYGRVKKTVVHVHNAGHGIPPSFLAKVAIKLNQARFRRFVDLPIAVSENAAAWGYGAKNAGSVFILKHGIDIDHFTFSEDKRALFRRQYSLSHQDVVYGTAGRMDDQKNHLFLLEIFAQIAKRRPESKFVLLGKGPLLPEILEKRETLGLSESLMIIDRVEDISLFYSGVDCFLFPSRFEGLGLVLIEAQCSGLPCLYSKRVIPDSAVSVTELAHGIDLNGNAAEWAEAAVEQCASMNRALYAEEVRSARYDILLTTVTYRELLEK